MKLKAFFIELFDVGIPEQETLGANDRFLIDDAAMNVKKFVKASKIGGGATSTLALTNAEASPITKGQPVKIFSDSSVKLAQANAPSSARVIGLVADDSIAASAPGNIMIGEGFPAVVPSGVQVGTWAAGDRIFLDVDNLGKLTNIPPSGSTGVIAPLGDVYDKSESDALVIFTKQLPIILGLLV